MKKQYDFSHGERGKFYRRSVQLHLPIYLNSENLKFVEKVAKKRKTNITAVVNEFIREDIKLAKMIGE